MYDFIHRARTPEEIACAYLADWLEYCLRAEAESDRNPPPVVERLRKLKAERAAAPGPPA